MEVPSTRIDGSWNVPYVTYLTLDFLENLCTPTGINMYYIHKLSSHLKHNKIRFQNKEESVNAI
jgi:hypothetical protein